jgi:hypothetical protein
MEKMIMKKIIRAISLLMLIVTLAACRENNQQPEKDSIPKSEVTTTPTNVESSDSIVTSNEVTDDKTEIKENITDSSSVSNNSEEEEDRYLTYVLGKCVWSDGREVVYLTDERDCDNWDVPIEGIGPGEPDSTAKLRFIGIDWNSDDTIKQIYFADFTVANTFGTLNNPGTSGTLNVNSYGPDVASVPTVSTWNIIVNGEEVILTDEDNDSYYFYEDHFDE